MMSKFIILVFSLLGLFSACVGQFVQLGQCDANIQLVQNFNIDQFLGTWYEVTRIENPNQGGSCSGYELTRTTNTLNVLYSSVNNNFLEEARGTVSQVNNTARLTMSISTFGNQTDFWILDTDYTTFSIAFSCENVSSLQRRLQIWVLGRTRTLTAMSLALIGTTIRNTFNIDPEILNSVDQSEVGCYILPVIQPGQPIVIPGQCDPNLPVVQNFNVERFLGTWHQVSSYYSPNSFGTCARAEYSLGNGVVNVLNSQVVNGNLLTIDGYATVSSTDNSAKLSVVLNIQGAPPATQDLWILASDYDNYAISYTCVNVSSTQKQVFSWILSRTRQLPATSQAAVDQVVNSYIDLNQVYYTETNQTDQGCFFYPDHVPGQTVVFRGQCESLDVQAMPSFDAARYMGLWHTIEMYPSGPQSGTCSNALYALGDGTVSVLNSHVINERLNTVNAVAVPVSTDGSAQLVVTFPVPGSNQTITSDYWVLGTDYTNYALVYSCSNVNSDEMRVTSWKLSRTKQLTQASATAITTIINNVLVLDQRYYEAMNQTTAGCFYFPDPQPGVPVVFPGQCASDVAVVQNFDFAQFQGTWYEVQSYPTTQQTGQCVGHQFTLESTTRLLLNTSSVTDQFQGLITASVEFSTNVSNGNLTISVADANGVVTRTQISILSVAYNDYALAYACVNIGEDFRGVWSWKLSRTQQLSAAANVAINTVIANNLVLDNDYYETIDHSERACAYLPVLQPGATITLPGQCDTTITGMPNFDLARWSGRWRLIESYGSRFQTGTCNVAEYTQETTLTLSVTNSQVANQQLASISGTASLISTDRSGKLLISFPSRSQTFELYILDTDYDSYALLYGCVNVGSTQRTISSWKFSRNNTLTEVAINNINQIINSIEVLNNRYYYTVNRTETGCFYYPPVDTTTGVRFRGQCNQNIPLVANFQPARYLGLWHDIESYPEDFQFGTCNNAYYSPGNDVDVYNTQVIDRQLFSINGSASLASTDGTGQLSVIFNVNGVDVTSNYLIMATDYDSYSFVYSCRPIDDEFVQVTTWKLSRTKTLTTTALTAINNVMNTVPVLDQRYYIARNQTPEGCFYYPEPQPGVPVVFPGQCDNNIAAMPNFNMNQFQGLWHEIQAYPKDEQSGQCINHRFTLNGTNIMDLQSSNVIGLELGVTNGSVRFTSTDNSGRLVINITSETGEVIEIPYWVISTDYNNYALAYACVNINSDYRKVWSWKLSRTQQLTATSTTAINAAMATIDVLENRYFEDIDQSDQACFHLPNIAAGQAVILPGQCDTNIRGVSNFNIARYAGRWRLIESYGSDFQVGTCNVARYTQESITALGVVNSQVVNQELASISGTATLASSDGSGTLRFYFPSRDESMDFIVLGTDYDSYALGYSCINLNNNQRRVYSWKLSRDNTLNGTAINNINAIINSIEVLHNPYYYTVDRTNTGCFYYPPVNTSTGVRFRGECNQNIPVVVNFQPARYLGLWHDIESYPGDFQFGTCNNAYYSPGNDVDVYNTQVIDQQLFSINGSASLASTDGTGQLSVIFNVNGVDVTSNYLIMATDYDSYSFVYSCRPIDDEFVQVTTWKLSRTKTLTAAAVTAINNVMNVVPVLDQRYYIARNQTPEGCFYYPEPQPGVPVVFPGQCDNNIAAMPNFNMNQFQGLWHEIQAYPKDEQSGQCINHRFTLNGINTLDLQSTNVFGQALGVTNGSVRFTSSDGSGRLVITITSDTGEVIDIPYWVLSTDYNNYALAYACVNINSDYRKVWSWKLSRTQQLTAASNTAINTAIANINVLDNRYYETIQQTDSACFYMPELGPNDPVVFPGQCDASIPVIQNFNAARYLGRWRLIESYYSEFQEGTCNTATYSLADDGSVIVLNTKVQNQQLSTITGSAVLASNDGTGKLLVTFPGTDTPSEYWILDTDYDSYALIYSCVNLPNNQRRVWSWKLSRTATLTASATTAINATVNRINVLDASYYQSIDRSNAGCFYYPTPDSNNNVIFPGQCDETIPVVTNFNANAYLGTWYDIESYPTNFQSGTCNTATYSLGTGNAILVQNTQVVNQVLQTTTGSAVTATTDGSAKLNVTFSLSSGDVSTKYWVLATDYTTYSLVYSCRNIDDEFRAVYSWKLGRQRTLPQAAVTTINNVINTVQVLEPQYFVQRQHTEEACFYYPDNQGGDVILNGQCEPNQVPAMTNFNPTMFSGTWYEVARFPSALQNGECIATQYTLASSNMFNVVKTSVVNETLMTSNTQGGVATDGRGVISININGVPFDNVYILNTDYSEYALAYSCRNLDANTKQVYSWKLGRSRAGLSSQANATIDQIVSGNIDLFESYYRYTGQDDSSCFYYPVFEQPPSVIELPGACNTSIRGVSNFNAAAYLGRWFETARYPQTAQTGQCNRAVYSSLPGGAVTVVNSQVIDARLASITGEATVASTDGSGQLNVVFVVNGEVRTSNYYVLATDYNSYALVYSCVNLPNGNRQVGSWKLSRNRTLTAQASTAMDAVINVTQGLNEDYYQSTSQSDESCFYVPPVDSNQAPLFRGQCQEITGVPGFNANRFLGWWHEIERFPSDDDVGECISSRYQSSGNTIQAVDTSIFDLTAQTENSTVTISNDGRLRRTFSNGRVQDLWVIATDYDNYALLYSCENVNDEYRRVWSAKHSKTRSLSQAAQNAMDLIIQANDLLYPEFYLPVNQSDNACFHYPEQIGTEVILPGQCDTSIPVVGSFDINNFQGNWYQIQRYGAVGDRSCIGQRLSYDDASGDIDILDYEVVGGELTTVGATGRIASTDGSGRLTVVRNVGDSGETSESIYILTTDYDQYALMYSCVNVDQFHRQVRAWQLSRERTMSVAGVSAINTIINQRPELHLPYFNLISHAGECPEPSSAFLINSSIILVLVCAILQLVW